MIRILAVTLFVVFGMSDAYGQEIASKGEEQARACVHERLVALIAAGTLNVSGDAALNACTDALRAELKAKKKTYCEAVSYVSWLVADENSKLNGLKSTPYHPDKAAIQRCNKSQTWDKHG